VLVAVLDACNKAFFAARKQQPLWPWYWCVVLVLVMGEKQ
jgi:hypothetical protein